jgi:hypothetical protein
MSYFASAMFDIMYIQGGGERREKWRTLASGLSCMSLLIPVSQRILLIC